MAKLFDPARFTEFAQTASVYFLQNGVSLNEGIQKVAQENALTPAQIMQVCQQANVITYESIFKTADDKTFEFPVADSKAVIEAMKVQPSQTESLIDYLTDPPQPKIAKSVDDYNRAFGVEEISNEPAVLEKVAQAKKLQDNMDAAQIEVQRQIQDNQLAIENSREKLAHEVRQLILDSDSSNVGSYQDILNAIAYGISTDNVKTAMREIIKIGDDLVQQGIFGAKAKRANELSVYLPPIVKEAEAVQDDLISSTQYTGTPGPMSDVRIVNGNHPLIMEVNTLVNQVSEDDRLKTGLSLLEDKANYVVKKISDINTSKTTDRYVQYETGDKPPVPADPGTKLRHFNSGVY